ncbi:saccharopine dehydrogenase family protein [Actinomadura chibensis]|uniref:Saccharopine dehydrogenase n=1 Tax=Actinomadura chibensis TaxID=392828 RepID=A0A5D0NWL3_9ACTN|nr:saccharopine dehydrogenase NADP-binding domain-containing protein [Actinomadura chibensis]TYB48847.1 saccharopine dehydrogenase [Actinomadura chibensis]
MKILALGGPGAMGRVAVRTATRLPGVREIIVADRDLDAARRLIRSLAGSPVTLRARKVDVTDEGELDALLDGADIVLNTVGPYYRFGPAVLRAAIRTHTHYLDICDDWEPTLSMLDLDGDARAAGVCAVVGMGASPGVSNLLAARAASRLDTVTDIYTAWPVDVPGSGADDTELRGRDGRPLAAAVHWMQQISGTIAEVRDGELVKRRPLRPVTLDLPGGRGGTAYTVGHPEPVTLRRTLRPSGDSANLMVITPGTVAYLDVLRRDIDAGRLTNETAAADLARPTMLRAIRAAVRATRFRGPGSLPMFFAAATGTKDDRATTVLTQLTQAGTLMQNMAEATGIPAALGLSQLVDGTVTRPGVHPPEAIIDPARFFTDLTQHAPPAKAMTEIAHG